MHYQMSMEIRPTLTEVLAGVRTFIVPSEQDPVYGYYVKRVALRGHTVWWMCSCDQWYHRVGPLGQDCKHITETKLWIKQRGGLAQIPRGTPQGARKLSQSVPRGIRR